MNFAKEKPSFQEHYYDSQKIDLENSQSRETPQEPPEQQYLDINLINIFGELGGFEAILNIINCSFTQSIDKNNSNTVYTPMSLIESIFKLVAGMNTKYIENFAQCYIQKIEKNFIFRFNQINDKEVKDLDLDMLKRILFELEKLLMLILDEKSVGKLLEDMELDLLFKFLESSSFDRKLKAINGFKDFQARSQEKNNEEYLNKASIKFYSPELYIQWVVEKNIIELIYDKYNHPELLKRSLDILKFIGSNGRIPISIIDTIWDACKEKSEDVVSTIYENIVELGPCLDVQTAQYFFSKFLTIKLDDFDEETIKLIGMYTLNSIDVIFPDHNRYYSDKSSQTIDENFNNNSTAEFRNYRLKLSGIPLLYNFTLDDVPLNRDLSEKAILFLIKIVEKKPRLDLFKNIIDNCFQNLKNEVSVYQSLHLVMAIFERFKRAEYAVCELVKIYYQKAAEQYPFSKLVVNSIINYCKNVKEKLTGLTANLGTANVEENCPEFEFVGKFSHQQNISKRIEALEFFIKPSYPAEDTIDYQEIDQLWEALVTDANFKFESKLFLDLISSLYINDSGQNLIFNQNICGYLFDKVLCNKEKFAPHKITLEKFNCLKFYFTLMNTKHAKLEIYGQLDNFRVKNLKLEGLDCIWNYFLVCKDDEISKQYTDFLVQIYLRLNEDLNKTRTEILSKLIDDTMEQITLSHQRG